MGAVAAEVETERRRRVVSLTSDGVSAAEIASYIGVAERTVVRIRLRCGIALPAPPPLADDEIRRAGELLDDGASLSETARTIGRSIHAIRRAFPGRGWSRLEQCEMVSLIQRFRGVL